jgi:putative colanic acid biosynthesis acetyltransferase WcaF
MRQDTDLGSIPSTFTFLQRARRFFWGVVYVSSFRLSPKVAHGWRRFILRRMGASIGRGAVIHPSVKIWAPWNLVMDDFACLGPFVDCYNVDSVRLGRHAVVSQYCFLCTASHDHTRLDLPLTTMPIEIGDFTWVCADVYLGPGVRIGEGAIVGARSSVYSHVTEWSVVAGNPATFRKERKVSNRSVQDRKVRT